MSIPIYPLENRTHSLFAQTGSSLLASEYFSFINGASERDSTMVEMLRVYSVDGISGERVDLVVMENLFYGYAGGLRLFDLNGMKG